MEIEYIRQFALLARDCHFQSAADELIHNRLIQIGSMHIRGLFSDGAFADNRSITRNKTYPKAGGNDLAEASEKHNPSVPVKILD